MFQTFHFTSRISYWRSVATLALAAELMGCGGETPPTNSAPLPTLSSKAQIGALLFSDRYMSGSGRMSCVNCHNPDALHGPPNALSVQIGGAMESEFGTRASPSLRYLDLIPAFSAGDGTAEGLRGGLMADGRANSLSEQVHLPLFGFREMDNGTVQSLADRIRKAPYSTQFSTAFGDLNDDARTVAFAEEALAAFQREDPRLHPYSSKLDAYRAGLVNLSEAEMRGLNHFRNPLTANCSHCHAGNLEVVGYDAARRNPPLFTNFGYAALGLPRNFDIPANADPGYFDMGVCGPFRTDMVDPRYCGLFRIPSLRNVAHRPVFFHNGIFKNLAQAVRFYVTRDSNPQEWYPRDQTGFFAFNDLPQNLHGNITRIAPFGSTTARLRAQEQADLVCFLETLSDGYRQGDMPRADCQQ